MRSFRFSCALVPMLCMIACGGSTTSPEDGQDSGVDAKGDTLVPPSDEGVPDVPPGDGGGETGPSDTISDTPPSGCITDTSAGTHVFTCDGFKYDVTVPAACVASPSTCGLVLDVHGATMSGKMEDNNTNMRALGDKFGYVVVQPNANPSPPASSWNPASDDDKVVALLKLAIDVYKVDKKRVHMTGFSQGGMMSSRFLCKHADLFASIAPAAGTGCTFKGTDTPSQEIPVLYLHGTTDALVSFSLGTAQRDALIAAWKMTGETVVSSDTQHKWSRWTNASGTTFEFIQHNYEASSFVLKGHCYPGSKDLKGGEPGQLFGFACVGTSAFTWGDVVMKFFVDHPRK